MSEINQITEINEEETPRVVVFEEALEAVLFAAGHPITYATLARVFELTPAVVKDKVFEYAMKYNDPSIPRGVILLTYKDSCQLCTKEHYLNEIRDALGIRKSGSLSTSSMEVLAIVAYNQPVTRVFVDTLRRADSSYAMNNLIDRGLIECKGRLDVPGRPMLYGTTPDFLRCFGLSDLSELPATSEDLQAMFEKAKAATEPKDEVIEGAEQVEMFDGETTPPLVEEQNDENAPLIPKDEVSDSQIPDEDEPSAEDDIHIDM